MRFRVNAFFSPRGWCILRSYRGRCLEMYGRSDSDIPAFRRHATIWSLLAFEFQMTGCSYCCVCCPFFECIQSRPYKHEWLLVVQPRTIFLHFTELVGLLAWSEPLNLIMNFLTSHISNIYLTVPFVIRLGLRSGILYTSLLCVLHSLPISFFDDRTCTWSWPHFTKLRIIISSPLPLVLRSKLKCKIHRYANPRIKRCSFLF
jgi:hypothetical protein